MIQFVAQQLNTETLRLSVVGNLTIYTAVDSKKQLIDALHDSQQLELDLSGVDEMDSAGFQLLLLLKRESQQHARTLLISSHSPAVQEVLMFYNMDRYLGLSAVLSAQPH